MNRLQSPVARSQRIQVATHKSRDNKIWFASKFPEAFTPERVLEVTSLYTNVSSPWEVKRMPCGAYVFSQLALAERPPTFIQLNALMMGNDVAAGYMIPTAVLGNEWKFPAPEKVEAKSWERELAAYVRAISLMIFYKIQHDLNEEFVGAAQPLLALKHGRGTCFERASLVASILRLNRIPSRIVGNTDMLKADLPGQKHHWWVEAKIGRRWIALDPNLHPASEAIARGALLDVPREGMDLMPYLDRVSFLEALRSKRPVHVIDDPGLRAHVKKRVIAPEMPLPVEASEISF